jgi:LDH2 family malate/lactate/ureidoglycolate dehydrogenase
VDERPTRIVPIEILRDLVQRLLSAAGCGPQAVATVADVFVTADLRGTGVQGLDHLPTMIRSLRNGKIDPDGRPRITRETAATALVDGGRGPGQVAGVFAADFAVRKAREAGACAVGIVNSSDIFMLAYYADRMARAGVVGIVMTNAPPLVHPHGGTERILGTNPIAIGIPGEGEHPLVADLSTSALSASRVRQAAYFGEPLPPGVAVDSEGRPTRNAALAAEGAIAPLAGAKGFALGLCVGILSGPLVGAAVGKALSGWLGNDPAGPKGHLLVAVDPAAFGEPAVFRAAVGAHLRELTGSRKAPGVSEIRIPGERGAVEAARRRRYGVPIYEVVWTRTARLAAELGVAMPVLAEGERGTRR